MSGHTGDNVRTTEDPQGRPSGQASTARCRCGWADCQDALAALATTAGPTVRAALRERLAEVHLGLAYGLAARYRSRGPGAEDIRQVAALALVEAIDRFDPGRGTPFWWFAAPTIAGTIKRHFRDVTWMLHPPRPVKDLRTRIRAVTDELTQHLQRAPTVADLADHLSCSPDEVGEAIRADEAAWPMSLDAPVRSAEDTTLAAVLGSPDRAYTHVENVETLRPYLAALPERTQWVLAMRFGDGLTQTEIANRVGCSQMHVSRILNRAIGQLRRGLDDRPAARTVSTGFRALQLRSTARR